MEVPDPDAPIAGLTQVLPNAVLYRAPTRRSWMIRASVFDGDGRRVDEAVCWHSAGARASRDADPPESANVGHLPGRWLFGGVSYGHFGHALCETTARLWALDQPGPTINGVIFFPETLDRTPEPGDLPILQLLGIAHPMRNLVGAARVDELVVPPQGMGTGDMMMGTPEYRSFVKSRIPGDLPDTGIRRLYISRSRNRAERGSILGETLLESYLAEAGYHVFHPQEQSIFDQARHYASADRIIGPDGSPFHLLAMTASDRKTVAVIKRRPGREFDLIRRHLRQFGIARAHAVNVMTCGWSPGGIRRAGLSVSGEIRFGELHGALVQAGLIPDGPAWPEPSEAERRDLLTELGEALDADLYQVKGPGASLSHLPRRRDRDLVGIYVRGAFPDA